MTLYYPPTSDFIQKTLDAQLSAGTTSSATLNNTTALQNKPGVMIIDRVNASGVETPTKVEVVIFTGTSGSTVTGLTRGQAGTSDQTHEIGAIVEFGPDVVWAQGIIDTMIVEHNADGTHKSALVTTLKSTGAEVNTGTEDAKIVTPKAIADSLLVKPSGSPSQGDIIYHNGSAWARLAAGTAGYFLKTLGAGANPAWAAAGVNVEMGTFTITNAGGTGAKTITMSASWTPKLVIFIGRYTTGTGFSMLSLGFYDGTNNLGICIADAVSANSHKTSTTNSIIMTTSVGADRRLGAGTSLGAGSIGYSMSDVSGGSDYDNWSYIALG